MQNKNTLLNGRILMCIYRSSYWIKPRQSDSPRPYSGWPKMDLVPGGGGVDVKKAGSAWPAQS